MERSGLIILAIVATLSAVTAQYCKYAEDRDCDSCCDGYCCSYSLSSGYIGLIFGLVGLIIVLLVCVCLWRFCRRQATVIVTGPIEDANIMTVNTSHVVSPVNHSHTGYNQQEQQQQWFQPIPQVQLQATASNSQAPPPSSSTKQCTNQKIGPL